MPDRCVMQTCEADPDARVSFFSFPKDPLVQEEWVLFVKKKRPEWVPKTGHKQNTICSLHFKEGDFDNYCRFKMGLAHRLLLKKDAVPSVYTKDRRPKDARCRYIFPETKLTEDKGVQCAQVMKSKAIQCSLDTTVFMDRMLINRKRGSNRRKMLHPTKITTQN